MDQKLESRSCSRNLHSRKISIGILADAASTAEAISRPPETLAKQSLHVTRQSRSTEKAFIHHCAHPVAEANGTENDVFFDKQSANEEYKKSRENRTNGHETLRKKLLEVLGNISSPIKSTGFNMDQVKEEIQSPVTKINLNSDTIESISEKQSPRRPIKRFTRRKKALTENKHLKLEIEKSASAKKGFPRKRLFSLKGDHYGKLYGNSNGSTFPSNKNRIAKESSRIGVHQGSKCDTATGKHQPESRRRSSGKFVEVSCANSLRAKENDKSSGWMISTLNVMAEQQGIEQPQDVAISNEQLVDQEYRETSYNVTKSNEGFVNIIKVSLKDRFTDPVVDEKYNSFNSPLKMMAQIQKGNEQSPDVGNFKNQLVNQKDKVSSLFGKTISRMNDEVPGANNTTKRNDAKDIVQPIDVERSDLMNHEGNLSNCSAKKRRTHAGNPPSPQCWINLIGHSMQRKEDTPPEKLHNFKNIRNFKSLCSSKSTEGKHKEGDELSDGRGKNFCVPIELTFNMDVGGKSQVQGSSTDGMDTERLGNDSPMADCIEPKQSLPQIHRDEKFQSDSDRTPANETNLLKESQESTPVSLEQNINADLDGGMTLLIMALERVKTKLSSMTSKRSVAILQSSSEGIHSLIQKAESQIKADMSKLTNLCHLTRELLETKFQETHERLVGVFKRFNEELEMQLQDYEGLIDDLEGHEVDLKRTVERQGATHKKIVSQVEHEINNRIQDAESKILAVQKSNQDKMLQLRTVVAESIKHVASL